MSDRLAGAGPRDGDSIFRAIGVVGDAWAWLILREAVFDGVGRFGEFQERLAAPRSTLTSRLSQLCDRGLLVRDRSIGQGYALTDAGQDFFGCLMVALRWGDRWRPDSSPAPQLVTHSSCGRRMAATLTCGHCQQELVANDVHAELADSWVPSSSRAGATTDRTRRRQPDLALLERGRPDSVAYTLTVTGDWWSGLLIREAFFGVRRFDDLTHRLDIAPNILSARLRRFVELGVLDKVPYQDWPVRHEYRLTKKGLDLYHVPLSLAMWGRRWLGPSDHDADLTHTCGHQVRAVLTCDSCHQPLARDDVTFAPNESAGGRD